MKPAPIPTDDGNQLIPFNAGDMANHFEWLEKGIGKISKRFNEVVPKEIGYQYIQRLKDMGWLENFVDAMEAYRCFQLHFIVIAMNNQLMGAVFDSNEKKAPEIKETYRHIIRDFSESGAKYNKALNDTLEKNGLSKLTNRQLDRGNDSIWESLRQELQEDPEAQDGETTFDLELKIHSSRKQKAAQNPNQGSVFMQSRRELSNAEYAELQEPVDTGKD